MNYGLPYQGGKSKIMKDLCKIFPFAKNFYDLFRGGFSVTHGMMLYRSKSYDKFHFNEIRPGIGKLVQDSIAGKYSYDNFKPEFISRERFFAEKENDPYVKICWSFGNNGKGYLFGKDIEGYKKSLHNAIIFNKFDDTAIKVLGIKRFPENVGIKDRRFFLRNKVAKNNPGDRRGELQQLQQLQRLQFYEGSFDKVPIENDSVIYCDIPYKGTGKYDGNKNFNRKAFFEWANEQKCPFFISEYDVECKNFKEIWRKNVSVSMQGGGGTRAVEKLYTNTYGMKAILQRLKARRFNG